MAMDQHAEQKRMPLVEALRVLAELRRDQIVVTTMGAAREWPRLSRHPLDLHYIPSAMGQAPALGLGLALGAPQREVWVLNGDGCMVMNLGSLVTVVASGAQNLSLLVLNNGLYEVTGGQRTAAAATAKCDFVGLARAAGWATAARFDELAGWREGVGAWLRGPGPRFGELVVQPVGTGYPLTSPGPMTERLRAFQAALGGKSERK